MVSMTCLISQNALQTTFELNTPRTAYTPIASFLFSYRPLNLHEKSPILPSTQASLLQKPIAFTLTLLDLSRHFHFLNVFPTRFHSAYDIESPLQQIKTPPERDFNLYHTFIGIRDDHYHRFH